MKNIFLAALLIFLSTATQAATVYKFSTNSYPWHGGTYISPEAACSAGSAYGYNGLFPITWGGGWQCRNGVNSTNYGQVYQTQDSCPAGYTENASGNCEEEQLCPNPGTPTTYWVDTYAGQTNLTTQKSKNGCLVSGTTLTDTGCRSYSPPKTAPNGSEVFACLINGEFSGEAANSTPDEEPEVTDDDSDKSQQTDTRQSTDNTSTSDKTITDNGDGTTTEEQTVTTTKTEGEGTVIWEANGNIYIQDSSGNITVTTQQTLIDRAADNSYTETITETTTFTTAEKTTQVINKTTAGVTSQNTPSQTSTQQKTTTNTYNSSGTQTGTTTITTGGLNTSEGTGDCPPNTDCGGDGDTAAGQPDFGVPDGSWWESQYPEGLSGIWSAHAASLDNGSVSTWLNSFGVPSSGSLPNWSFSCDLGIVNFGTCDLSPPDYIWAAIRIFILLTAIFLCRKLIFGG